MTFTSTGTPATLTSHQRQYIDKEGNYISIEEWVVLFENEDYRRIGDSYSEDDKTNVSTVWLGTPTCIFETMIFVENSNEELGQRYTTKEAAEKGHAYFVNKYIERPKLIREFVNNGNPQVLAEGEL